VPLASLTVPRRPTQMHRVATMVRHRCCPRRPPRGELRSTCQDSVLLIGRFAAAAVDVLGLDWFLLVVHDIGGPVGFEVTAAALDRVASLVGTEFTGGG
jgi:hypothetical protein